MGSYSVYKHTAPNGKIYIGITSQEPTKRWGNGCNYHNQKYFYHAIEKYGWSNIQHEVLFSALTKEDAELKEIELISLYKSNNREYGYNIDNGGKSKGRCSEETKKLLSEMQRGRKQSQETIKKRVESRKGYRHSAETIEKIRKANKGREFTLEQINKMKENRKPMVFTDEIKHKISEGIKASWTPERRKHMSEISKGRKGQVWTEEQIQWFRDNNRGAKSVLSKKVGQFDLKGNLICTFGSAREAGRNGFTYSGVSAVCRGEKHTHHGFVWKYLEE